MSLALKISNDIEDCVQAWIYQHAEKDVTKLAHYEAIFFLKYPDVETDKIFDVLWHAAFRKQFYQYCGGEAVKPDNQEHPNKMCAE